MTAWGVTGRVELRTQYDPWFTDCYDVVVDGARVNFVGRSRCRRSGEIWGESNGGRWFQSLDEAVMGALRQSAADVWRAERPVVAKVARCHGESPGPDGWDAWAPGPRFLYCTGSWRNAMAEAHAYARAEYARQATS